MEAVALIPISPEFHLHNTTFSRDRTAPPNPIAFDDPFGYQYHYTSTPASPAQMTAWAHPTPNSRRLNVDGVSVFDFALSPSRYNQPIGHLSPEITASDKVFEKQLRAKGRNSMAANPSRNDRRKSRSISPFRDVGLLAKNASPSANPTKSGLSSKWPRLKDLLLFRSASDGRTTGRGSKDPLQKYTIFPPDSPLNKERGEEDKKAGGGGRGGGEKVRRGRKRSVSAHEKHYMENRAAAEEQKRKTPLPFQRHGLLGFIDFTPAIRGEEQGGRCFLFGSFPKGKF